MNSFALLIGKCVIVPPSIKAALLIVMWFGGVPPQLEWSTMADHLVRQYIAAGLKPAEAVKEVKWVEACFRTYVVPPDMKR